MVGRIFPLMGQVAAGAPVITKGPVAPVRPTPTLFLDVSGFTSYLKEKQYGFTDSAGILYGQAETSFWSMGARARLVASILWGGGWRAQPFIGGSVSRNFGVDQTFNQPTQTGIAGATFLLTRTRRSGSSKAALTSSAEAGPWSH